MTGFHDFVLDPEDPLARGFRVGPAPKHFGSQYCPAGFSTPWDGPPRFLARRAHRRVAEETGQTIQWGR